MKTYTNRPIEQFDAVKPETINDNLDDTLDQLNGNLDANNLPVASVVEGNLVKSRLVSAETGDVEKFSVEYPTQGYHSCKRWGWDGNVPGSYGQHPDATLDLKNNAWRRGFNSLTELGNYDDFYLDFNAKQGMLVGQAVIDWEHGTNVFAISALGDAKIAYGQSQWSEWGVFVNNILVARTGYIYPRRHTTCIPFSIPIGSQSVRIEVKFVTNTGGIVGAAPLDNNPTPLYVFGAEIVCRNTYR